MVFCTDYRVIFSFFAHFNLTITQMCLKSLVNELPGETARKHQYFPFISLDLYNNIFCWLYEEKSLMSFHMIYVGNINHFLKCLFFSLCYCEFLYSVPVILI